MKCYHCKSEEFFLQRNGRKYDIYCAICGNFKKQATKKEIALLTHRTGGDKK